MCATCLLSSYLFVGPNILPFVVISNFSHNSSIASNTNVNKYYKIHSLLLPIYNVACRTRSKFPQRDKTCAINTLGTHYFYNNTIFRYTLLQKQYTENKNVKKTEVTLTQEHTDHKTLFTGNISDFNLFSGNSSGLKSLESGQQAIERHPTSRNKLNAANCDFSVEKPAILLLRLSADLLVEFFFYLWPEDTALGVVSEGLCGAGPLSRIQCIIYRIFPLTLINKLCFILWCFSHVA